MTRDALGLPLARAEALFAGRTCQVEWTLPPKRPDKAGSARVVRAVERGETVVLTVSLFEDTPKEEP